MTNHTTTNTTTNTTESTTPPPAPFKIRRAARPKLIQQQYDIPVGIAITGRFGSGKSYIAEILTMYGYQRFSFAKVLRDTVCQNIEAAHGDLNRLYLNFKPFFNKARKVPADGFWEILHALMLLPPSALYAEIYGKPTSARMRWLLQYFGADIGRAGDPYVWCKALMADYKSRRPALMVIDDWRFPEETIVWDWLGVRPLTIRLDVPLTNPLDPTTKHSSESHIKSLAVDYELYNGPDQRITPSALDSTILTAKALLQRRGVALDTVPVKLHRPNLSSPGSTAAKRSKAMRQRR